MVNGELSMADCQCDVFEATQCCEKDRALAIERWQLLIDG